MRYFPLISTLLAYRPSSPFQHINANKPCILVTFGYHIIHIILTG